MERLQAAIEKARSQRDGQDSPRRRAGDAAAPPVTATVREAWEALAELQFKKRSLPRNRVFTHKGGPEAAPFDLLRTRMLQQARQQGWRRIAVVSPHAACGKTTIAANLVFSLARQQDTRSMIFDFDLRRAGLSRLFRQNPAHGMADILEGREAFADHGRRHGSNVALGFNRGSVNNASEVLQSPRTGHVLDALQATYQPDLMLFDLPPLMTSDDNYGFLQNVDAALILAAAERTTMNQIDVAERQVAELTNVMGIVLNRCRYTDGAYGHEYSTY